MAEGKNIVVDLDRQKLFAYQGNELVYSFHCVTGREGKETDIGKHQIFRKAHPYRSKTYNVPMDYAMFFTKDGKAIHQSRSVFVRSLLMSVDAEQLLGPHIGSHGCVGLSEDDARNLYNWAEIGTGVTVK